MRGDAIRSVLATMVGQIGVAMAVMTVPVLAPQIAVTLKIDPSRIGLYSTIVFFGAIAFTSLAGSVTHRFGAVRTTQIAMLLAAGGLAVSLTGWLVPIVIGAFAIGMGYGVATPAASHLLARTISRKRRGLVFSIKQTGVPLGGFLLGLTVPVIAALFGWPWSLATVIAALLVIAAAIQPVRNRFDLDRNPGSRIGGTETLAAIRMVLDDPRLSPLALSSFIYAMMQLSIFTYYVVVLVERGGLEPVAAGAVFSIMHVGGILGRPLLGWISDRILTARILLSIVGLGIFLCGLAMAALDEAWPRVLLYLVSFAAGIITAGWNGVYIAEIARVMEPEDVGRATGGVSAFTFLGVATGPAIFSAVVAVSDSYAAAFLTIGTIALIPATFLLNPPRAKRK